MRDSAEHEETGTLRWSKLGFMLELDDGDVWLLEIRWMLMPWAKVNRRVTIQATKVSFATLAVSGIRLLD